MHFNSQHKAKVARREADQESNGKTICGGKRDMQREQRKLL